MISPNEGNESAASSVNLTDLVAKVFKPGGWLQEALSLEHRPEQDTMATTVSQSMSRDQALIFDALTFQSKHNSKTGAKSDYLRLKI